MLFYIWVRFEWQFSIGSIIALFHDVTITLGIFSILSNITDLKQREKSLKQLNDAIEVTPNAILLWDNEHRLIMGNKAARDIQKNLDYDLKPGILRKDMIDNVEKKGLVAIPEGMSADEFYSQRRVATKSSKNHTKTRPNNHRMIVS